MSPSQKQPVASSDLLRFIVQALVQKADAIRIDEATDERNRVVKLAVDAGDLGRVIGKDGRTASALRTILGVATSGDERKAKLDIA